MIYMQNKNITIRSMEFEDANIIYETYLSYHWHPTLDTYLNYYKEQQEGKRIVCIAQYDSQVAGLATLVLHPTEGPFANQEIPEIVDVCVFFHLHNKGIGNCLLDACEAQAAHYSKQVYLGVGLHSGYGPAQRIYAKRGYIPDGSGVWYQNEPLEQYANCCNDDDLLLFLIKDLCA